ncbi:UNVERIFIED_CONTAM: hypothetical protein GTU68_059254, partial [Idotea baltica]|nr:hypothetical protein [Idotea baltica]
DYVIGDVVGKGGFGTVKEGWRLKDDLSVAFKRIEKARVPKWEDKKKTLPKEIAILERLSLVPNVVHLLGWFEDDISFLLVLERPDPCVDLFDYIQQQGFLYEPQAKQLFKDAVTIVNDVFEQGVLHLDIKSQNFLVTIDWSGIPSLKLIDFGSADYVSEKPYRRMSGTTLFYPSEWFLLGRFYGLFGTVWSLGVLLFDMTNGRLPFRSKEDIMSGVFCFQRSGLTEDLKNLICSLLNPDPCKRLSLDRILEHRWFTEERSRSDEDSTGSCQTTSSEELGT